MLDPGEQLLDGVEIGRREFEFADDGDNGEYCAASGDAATRGGGIAIDGNGNIFHEVAIYMERIDDVESAFLQSFDDGRFDQIAFCGGGHS